MNYELEERQIINYLRKNASNNENQNKIRNKLLGLFFKKINEIPIAVCIENYQELLKEFPIYFHNKTREEIIKLFNSEVCPKKPIIYNYDLETLTYDIKPNNSLEISNKTFRPIYQENWKEKTSIINEISYEKQQSFYIDYLRYYLKFKKFPDFNDFINFIYYKYNKPVHKDISIVYDNINNSYIPIKDYINEFNMDYNSIKKIIIQSASIENRKQFQKTY